MTGQRFCKKRVSDADMIINITGDQLIKDLLQWRKKNGLALLRAR
jgi:hypothetical protein